MAQATNSEQSAARVAELSRRAKRAAMEIAGIVAKTENPTIIGECLPSALRIIEDADRLMRVTQPVDEAPRRSSAKPKKSGRKAPIVADQVKSGNQDGPVDAELAR